MAKTPTKRPETPIEWDAKPQNLAADPTATVDLDRAEWEAIGAPFSEVDDGDGETPGLATGTLRADGKSVRIGVLDYGENSTYLLVPGPDPARLSATVTVLEALEAIGFLSIQEDLLDLVDVAPPPTLEDRVSELEGVLASVLSEEHEGSVQGKVGLTQPPRSRTRRPLVLPRLRDKRSYVSKSTGKMSAPSAGNKVLMEDIGGRKKSFTGVVKWFSVDKGYGFIKPDAGERDLFVGYLGSGAKGFKPLRKNAIVNLKTLDLLDIEVVDGD